MRVMLMLLPLAAAACLAQDDPQFTYLAPGTPQVGGVQDLCLIYHGQQVRERWTADALLPYVACVDEQGQPQDWLFDSFLFIEFAADRGAFLHAYSKDRPEATAEDWAWLADCWFREDTGLIGLEGAVAQAGQQLGQPDRKVKVVISLPIPCVPLGEFGPLPGDAEKLDFSQEEHRQHALRWYLQRVLASWEAAGYQHLDLAGFYWMAESIPSADHDLVAWTAAYVHEAGYRLYWIPYFGGSGLTGWRELGLDAVMLQPNYFFQQEPDLHRLLLAAQVAGMAGTGIEIEFDARALTSDDFYHRLYAYLDAGARYGWMNGAVLGYYEGGRALKQFAQTPGRGRELYQAVCRFVQGSYQDSGLTDLASLSLVTRDNRENLALASRGAKIHDAARPEQYPELAPEKIIDGDIYLYGGMSGFGYFAIPGSFTLELPEVSTVARTQVMLWDRDGRVFRYRVETSPDNETWEPAVDKSEGEWRGWQVDEFAPRQAKYLRFTGLYNSVNDLFQVVEFEVYATHE